MTLPTAATTDHPIGTPQEWREARLALLEAEKDLTRRSDELARQRQALPWVPITTDYRFTSDRGEVGLADLFQGRSQLMIQHFMYPPSMGDAGCPSCSSFADAWNGIRVHLENHDVAMVAVSRAPIEQLAAYKARMGWSFPWVSSAGTSFNLDFAVSFTEDQIARGEAEANFRSFAIDPSMLPEGGEGTGYVDAGESPGLSTFVLRDGVVHHAYSAYARGVDGLWSMYQFLDRAPLGRNEAEGQWFRRHDEYEQGVAAPTVGSSR